MSTCLASHAVLACAPQAGVALMWGWIGSLAIVGLPIYESFDGIMAIFIPKKKSETAKPTATVDVVDSNTSTPAPVAEVTVA